MFRDNRAEIASDLMELVDSARTPREMRDAERIPEELAAEHGRHDLLVGAIEEISRRILYEECGQGEEKMPLTQQEEDALRKIVRDSTPMKSVNPVAVDMGTTAVAEGHEIERLTRRSLAAPRTLTGQGQDGAYSLPDQEAVISRVRHTMRKGESLIQWYARVGLGKAQILSMDKAAITSFVAQADRNNEESGVREPRTSLRLGPPAPQPRFVLVG